MCLIKRANWQMSSYNLFRSNHIMVLHSLSIKTTTTRKHRHTYPHTHTHTHTEREKLIKPRQSYKSTTSSFISNLGEKHLTKIYNYKMSCHNTLLSSRRLVTSWTAQIDEVSPHSSIITGLCVSSWCYHYRTVC